MDSSRGRIHGTEMEWGFMKSDPDIRSDLVMIDGEGIDNMIIAELAANSVARITGNVPSHFLSNGARFYADVRQRWEYATPEDDSYKGTFANEVASEKFLAGVAERYFDTYGRRVSLTKRVIDDNEASCGYHLSLGLDAKRVQINERDLALYGVFAATRAIVFGSGALLPNKKFIIGQKAYTANVDFHHGTVIEKPVVNLRNEPHADTNRFVRLHDTSSDPTVSPWASRTKIGAASLVATLMEHGDHLPHLRFNAPLHTISRQVSADTSLSKRYKLLDGSSITAIDTQKQIIGAIKDLSKELTFSEEDQWTIEEWDKALSDLEQDFWLAKKRIEWVSRASILAAQHDKHGWGWESHRLRHSDRQFSEIATSGLVTLLREKLWSDYMPDQDFMDNRIQNPPLATRARVRGNFIKYVSGDLIHFPITLDWQKIKYRDILYELTDPYTNTHAQLDKIMAA